MFANILRPGAKRKTFAPGTISNQPIRPLFDLRPMNLRFSAVAIARSWLAALAISAMPFIVRAQEAPDPATGLQRNVIFSEYTPLSGSVELVHRTLSPLVNVEIARAAKSEPLRPQAIDLAQERFLLFVPAQRPTQGYALMAFIPPWQDAHLPAGWATVLNEHGMIFVSAAKSGNEENVLDRRIPWRCSALTT